ncbi:MAG: response regulator, partial [Candidatus Omnitrophota bacterium]
MAAKKILIIDDEEDLRENLKYVFKMKGYDVELASDGVQGLKKLETYTPDLIVLDLNMPLLDGYGVVQRLRQGPVAPLNRDVRIVAYTSDPVHLTSVKTTKAGMDARNVARIDIIKRPGGALDRYYELIPVTSAVKDDPATLAIVNDWESKLSVEMDRPVGASSEPLDAINQRVRSRETNLANLVADAIRQEVHADVALVNSGGIRGNRVYP